ncbi:MAG: hydroxymethylbilane synthase [Chloroflexi bacterium]|nr:hydroxymethylbilane synthase [Chloroflexota bacterium]
MKPPRPVVVGTRGSALALIQTEEVLAQLRALFPERSFTVRVVRTGGDVAPQESLASLGLGVFTRELEAALLSGEIDLAVHSLKDLSTEQPPGLTLASVPRRTDPRDVLVSSAGATLRELPPGARVGTSSPRRAALLRAMRPDLKVSPVRGNVDTRVRKALGGEYEAVVLAAAGLTRLGLQERATEHFDPYSFVPAVGQGALAVEARAGDEEILSLVRPLDHPGTLAAVTAERAFLRAMGGGCRVPMAAYGEVVEEGGRAPRLALHGLLITEDGRHVFRARTVAPARDPEAAGLALAQQILGMGAQETLQKEGA